ncbi:MAG: hypothetical protein AB7F98_10800 [Novosphingobium sp.]
MPRSRAILIGAGALAVLAAAVFAFRGPDGSGGSATITSGAPAGTASQSLDDVDTMMGRLAERLEKNPNDGEGFRMLGWSYVMTGHPEKALEPYRRAIALLPQSATVHAGYGEAMVGVAKDIVTPEAKAEFERAIALDRNEPRARFFQALWLAQHGQEKQALDQWIALANSAPADAAWQEDLHKRIRDTAGKLGVDVASRLKNTPPVANAAAAPPIDNAAMQSASALPPADRQAMVDQMVEGLAAKLRANPKDADGWIRLLRSRMVLGQGSQAARDLASARQAFAGNAAELARIDAAAREFDVPAKP